MAKPTSGPAKNIKKPNPVTNKPETIKSVTKNAPAVKKGLDKAANKPNKVEKLIQDVTNRYRVTAREARDIVTSVANAASVGYSNMGPYTTAGPKTGMMAKDIAKQVKETAVAAATGKKGTTPIKVLNQGGDTWTRRNGEVQIAKSVTPGKKRK